MLSPVDSYKKLEILVKSEGISFYALAKELDFPSSFFSEWKRGKMMPKAEKLIPLAKHFNVPMEYFMAEKEMGK